MLRHQKSITIGSGSSQRKIGPQHEPFIIAEISGNHNGSLDAALELVDLAAKSGAHALKLQTYTADTITIDSNENEFFIKDPNSLWAGESLYNLYKKAHTPWDWHKPIFEKCKKLGLIYFSSPFDDTAVDLLESLEVPCYKIASFESNHIPLIKRVARTKKPMIISTGLAKASDIELAVETALSNGCSDLILLKCTSSYPADPAESHLNTIPHMRNLFDVQVGLSDHTMGIGAAVAAVALGATVIEKHFIKDRQGGGVDSAFSLEPQELTALVNETKTAWQALGSVHYGASERERKSLQFRRSIYVVADIKSGEAFSEKNIRVIRPGLGMEPKFFEQMMGKKATRDIKRGTALNWEMIG